MLSKDHFDHADIYSDHAEGSTVDQEWSRAHEATGATTA